MHLDAGVLGVYECACVHLCDGAAEAKHRSIVEVMFTSKTCAGRQPRYMVLLDRACALHTNEGET